jgi:dihydroxyacetone kinase-like predicted kinase
MTPKELHLLLKEKSVEGASKQSQKRLLNKTAKQVGSGLTSIREHLRHFHIDYVKYKRFDIYSLLNKELLCYDKEINKTLNNELGKYTR